MGLLVGSPIPSDPSGFFKAPASDLSRRYEALRSLLEGELEMRFGGNPIEGSNPSLSAITSRTKRHLPVVRDGLFIQEFEASGPSA